MDHRGFGHCHAGGWVAGAELRHAGKKLQHIPKHLYDVADPQFKREMSVLLGPAILPGNKVDVLQNGQEIFPAMLAAIRAAQRTITFETYIYWSGEIGREFSEALSERARAGWRCASPSTGAAA